MYEYYNYENSASQQEELRRRQIEMRRAEKSASRRKVLLALVCALIFGVVSGGIFLGISVVGNKLLGTPNLLTEDGQKSSSIQAPVEEQQPVTEEKEEPAPEVQSEGSDVAINKAEPAVATAPDENAAVASVTDVVKVAMPSIVAITNKSVQEIRMMFSYETQLYESESQGSGIIVGQDDDELLILTNNHVVDGAETLSVCFIDDEVIEADVKGTDASMDIAVISVPLDQIKESTQKAIKVALIGDSDALEIGEQVVAIGNALGYGQAVTTGIVSALNRDIEMAHLSSGLIQTDAAINPGNSGGALLNMRGEVIGINSAKLSDTKVEGMCYAIPINTALPVAEKLMSRASRNQVAPEDAGYMGIVGVLISRADSAKYNMPEGIYLQQIVENSPAEQAGLQVGDILKKFDDMSIDSYAELQNQLNYYAAGEKVDLIIYRQENGEYVERTVTITLGKRLD